MEGSDGAASRDAQSEYLVARGRDEGVTVPGLLDDPDTRLRGEDHQHPGTHVALAVRANYYQYNQHFLPHITSDIE